MFKVVHPLSRLRSGLTGTLVLSLSGFLLTACILTADQSIEGNPNDPRAQDHRRQVRVARFAAAPDHRCRKHRHRAAAEFLAARDLSQRRHDAAGRSRWPNADDTASGSGYDLNFENAPVATVAKVILGDILGVGYTIDPRVQGTVTLASVRPVAKADALLRAGKRAAHVRRGAGARPRGGYRLLPAQRGRPRRRRPHGGGRGRARASAWCRCATSRRRPSSSCWTRSASRPRRCARTTRATP